MLLNNLRQLIIQNCFILLDKYKCYHYIFRQFRNVFESELFIDYQSKILIHLGRHKEQDSLLVIVEAVFPSVKQCSLNQTNDIKKQENIIMKIDHNISDLKEIIQTNNTNGTINCNIDELFHNLYNRIGNFGRNM